MSNPIEIANDIKAAILELAAGRDYPDLLEAVDSLLIRASNKGYAQGVIDGKVIGSLASTPPPISASKEAAPEGLWSRRWYGSPPCEGWSIMQGRTEIAVLGKDVPEKAVDAIIDAHNYEREKAHEGPLVGDQIPVGQFAEPQRQSGETCPIVASPAPAQELDRLRELAATCYAGLGTECDLPEKWLDTLLAAAEGKPFTVDGLLPFTAPAQAPGEHHVDSATRPVNPDRGDSVAGVDGRQVEPHDSDVKGSPSEAEALHDSGVMPSSAVKAPEPLAELAYAHCFKAFEMPPQGAQLYMFDVNRLAALLSAFAKSEPRAPVLTKVRQLLERMDRRGGLGLDVHEWIRDGLDELDRIERAASQAPGAGGEG